jgi:hypothetical protein
MIDLTTRARAGAVECIAEQRDCLPSGMRAFHAVTLPENVHYFTDMAAYAPSNTAGLTEHLLLNGDTQTFDFVALAKEFEDDAR